MTIEATPVAASADAPSQIIEHQDTLETPRAGQVPEAEAPKPEAKPLSTREAIAKAFDENEQAVKDKAKTAAENAGEKVKEAEAQEKAEKATKPRAEDGKFAKAEDKNTADEAKPKAEQGAPEKAATGQEGADRRQSEGQHREPPARFLPEARTKWANVPNEVKAEVHRVAQEYESELTTARESASKFEEIREYDDLARQNGRGGVKDSLAKVVQIEQALARNPVIGLEMILREVGPRRADGSPLSLYEIAQHVAKLTPQQYAQNMHGAVPQGRPVQQAQANPEVAALKTELNEIKSTLAQQRAAPIIENFKAERPDYETLAPQIAEILKSQVIDKIYGTGLTPEQKLEQAYRMAGGQGPSSRSEAPEAAPAHPQATPAAHPVDPDGQKSVRGAPTSGQTGEPPRKFKTNRAALEAAFASVPR